MAYIVRFTVEGVGPFPTDMLRYDACWPSDPESAVAITGDGRKRIKLSAFRTSKTGEPTIGRWASFGWAVVDREMAVKV